MVKTRKPVLSNLLCSLLVLTGTTQTHAAAGAPSGLDKDALQSIYDKGAFPAADNTPVPLPKAVISARDGARAQASQKLKINTDKQILFGDTHVHTTYSADAFNFSLPIMHGSRGAFPPSDACDYARYVSQLDFYFLTDHAKSLSPEKWRDSIESVRLCNEIAGDPKNPDLAAFIGFEWTQVGATAEQHYGHHNVLFRDYLPEKVPARPIAAASTRKLNAYSGRGKKLPGVLPWLDFSNRSYYKSFNRAAEALSGMPVCESGVNSRELPPDCFEAVPVPGELFAKLDEWGFDHMAIPHGMAWGRSAPPGATWNKMLDNKEVFNDRAPILEIYSGHGNSEQYRDFAARRLDADGNPYCPEPTSDYLSACWQAGAIIHERCLEEGGDTATCELRAKNARRNYVLTPTQFGWLTVPGTQPEDWLDAGQARNMFLPAFNYRPQKSAQYGLAMRNLDDPDQPQGFRWGFIGSTDTHSARPGTGFKQTDRLASTDATGPGNSFWDWLLKRKQRDPSSVPVEVTNELALSLGSMARENERLTSFLSLGGIAAVHSEGRDRDAIWEAMKRREVYGTSGPRILLWFDMLQDNGKLPMGGEAVTDRNPRFRVSAIGSFKQLPGCPAYVKKELSDKKLQRLAGGECYHPSDERYRITRIEVVRIRPQINASETAAGLIEDTWRSFDCPDDPAGCTVEFEDPDYQKLSRDTTYYVRAIQEPMPTVNGGNLRTQFDKTGNPVSTQPCYGGFQTDATDQCLSDAEHRAWSSPIFLEYDGAQVNLSSCEVSPNRGAMELKVQWQDPDFDPQQSAFYYVRVMENPSCRWSTYDALRLGIEPVAGVSPVIQERAWSSPIWYTP